jgi:hypothetical protein
MNNVKVDYQLGLLINILHYQIWINKMSQNNNFNSMYKLDCNKFIWILLIIHVSQKHCLTFNNQILYVAIKKNKRVVVFHLCYYDFTIHATLGLL